MKKLAKLLIITALLGGSHAVQAQTTETAPRAGDTAITTTHDDDDKGKWGLAGLLGLLGLLGMKRHDRDDRHTHTTTNR